MTAFGPIADKGCFEIPQCGRFPGVCYLPLRSTGEIAGETARFHHAARWCGGVAARGARAAGCSNAAHLIRCDLADHRPMARSEPIEILLAFLLSSLSGGLSRYGDTGRTSCDAFLVQSQRLHWLLASLVLWPLPSRAAPPNKPYPPIPPAIPIKSWADAFSLSRKICRRRKPTQSRQADLCSYHMQDKRHG